MDDPPTDLEIEVSTNNIQELNTEQSYLCLDTNTILNNNSTCQDNFIINHPENCYQESENGILIGIYHLNENQSALHKLLTSWGLLELYEYLNGENN